jgi:hypothetical protein
VQRRRRLARWHTANLGARLPMRRAAPAPKRRFGSKHGSGNANAVPRRGKSRIADLDRGESFGFLGFDFRRMRSLRGPQTSGSSGKRTLIGQ